MAAKLENSEVRIGVILPKKWDDHIQRIAEREVTNRSAIYRRAIQQYLERQKRRETRK